MTRSSRSNLEILGYEETALGLLCLRRRELLSQPGTFVTEITLDHELLMSSYNTASERALARIGLEMTEGTDSLRVLVGGFGLGYTAAEVLESPRVARATVVEYLPQVIAWLEAGLMPLAPVLQADPRFDLRRGDVYALLDPLQEHTSDVDSDGSGEEIFELILVDVDHSPDERLSGSSVSFYTAAGLARARSHLRPGGVLGVWSYAESSPFADAMRSEFSDVRVERVTFVNELIDEEETDWLFFGRRSRV